MQSDLKSKRSLQGDEKYYLTDLSFNFSSNVDKRINYGPVLENVVYNYFKLHDFSISVGRIGKLEIDFTLSKSFNNSFHTFKFAKR